MNTVVRTCENSQLLITTVATTSPIRPPVSLLSAQMVVLRSRSTVQTLSSLQAPRSRMLPGSQHWASRGGICPGYGSTQVYLQRACVLELGWAYGQEAGPLPRQCSSQASGLASVQCRGGSGPQGPSPSGTRLRSLDNGAWGGPSLAALFIPLLPLPEGCSTEARSPVATRLGDSQSS